MICSTDSGTNIFNQIKRRNPEAEFVSSYPEIIYECILVCILCILFWVLGRFVSVLLAHT